MKRYGDLFDKICSVENLLLADKNASKGKLHTQEVIEHNKHKMTDLMQIRQMLISGTFRTSPYFIFTIHEPKERIIYKLPYFPDRIVHHAIANVLKPLWYRSFTSDSYSCIEGKGIHLCAENVKRALNKDERGTQFCLKTDIRKFYQTVNHSVLKMALALKIKDKRVLALLYEIVDSVPSGIPIGNYLSQFFANIYLTRFDHWIKEVKRVKYYFRYADDMVFLHSSKQFLHSLVPEIKEYFNTLKISLKNNWQVFPVAARGIDFVGYVFYHHYTILRKSVKQNFCRKAARLNKSNIGRKNYLQALCSWWGWAKHCNCRHLIHKLNTTAKYEIKFG